MPSIQLDPILNKEKLFQLTPAASISLSDLPALPSDWLVKLAELCRKTHSSLGDEPFNKHISTRYYNSSMQESMQLIYHRLSGNLNNLLGTLTESESGVIVLKLVDGVQHCSEGFFNRVNEITESFLIPHGLPELLYQVRVGLVKNVANRLIANINGNHHGNEIHDWNKVTKLAENNGFGIKANFGDDPYGTALEEEAILAALKEKFKTEYTPFNLPFLLTDQLHTLFGIDYTGRKDDEQGYTVGQYEKMLETIKRYLPEEMAKDISITDCFITDDDYVVRDVNWQFIRACFFNTLHQEGYFTEEPRIGNLLDCARYSGIKLEDNALSGFEDKYITPELFNSEGYWQLEKIQVDFPAFWQPLRSKENLISLAVRVLEKGSLLAANKLYKPLFSLDWSSAAPSDQAVIKQLFLRRTSHNMNLLQRSAVSENNKLKPLLDFLGEHHTLFSKEEIRDVFLGKDKDDMNLLMCASFPNRKKVDMYMQSHLPIYQPTGLKPLLTFIDTHRELFDEATIREMFLQKEKTEGMNVLMGAAAYGEHVVEDLLTFLDTHPTLFGKEEIRTIFLEKDSDNMGVLITAAQNHPQEIKPLLAFIEKNNTPFNQQELQDIFLQKDGYGRNMLMSATFQHQPEAVKSLLAFIETQSELFGKEIIQKILLETDPSNANVLLTAVWPNNPVLNENPVHVSNLSNSQPEELEHLLKFIDKHNELFAPDILGQMLLKTDEAGWNALMIAVNRRPKAVEPLLAFIDKHSELFGPQILQQMFLKEDRSGRNALMIALNHQPSTVKPLLEFMGKQSELLGQQTLQQILFKKENGSRHSTLMLIVQSRMVEPLLAFIEKSTVQFDVITMQQMFIRNNIQWNASIAPILLNKHLADFSMREKENANHRAGFFKPPFSLQEEKEAALTLKIALESNVSINELLNLKQIYPALGTGKLSLLFNAFYDLVSKGVVFNQVTEVTPSAPLNR